MGFVNTPSTVDSDYRGEIGVILVNLSNEPFTVNDGERICQMVITRYTRVDPFGKESPDVHPGRAGSSIFRQLVM
mgnify:CR=1 FL=1